MTSDEIITALRRRHPAFDPQVNGVGRWVTLTEWHNIDLLALDAWQKADVVGYEVKVSRGDMRGELLKPGKRARAVAMCTRFYFACPAGMLKPEEREFVEPEWSREDFERPRCTNEHCTTNDRRYRKMPKPRGSRVRGTDMEGVSVHMGYYIEHQPRFGKSYRGTGAIHACCNVCKGYGTTGRSRVEREAPTLWVPKDVGLVVVGEKGGAVTLKEAPRRKVTDPVIPYPYAGPQRSTDSSLRDEELARMERQAIAQIVRWASFRPDPRHSQHAHHVD